MRIRTIYTESEAYVGRLSPFPAQCGAVILHDVGDCTPGILRAIEDHVESRGYTKLYATAIRESEFANCLSHRQWDTIDEFTNRRTGNDVLVFARTLWPEPDSPRRLYEPWDTERLILHPKEPEDTQCEKP